MGLWSFPATAIPHITQMIAMGDGVEDMQGIDGAKLIGMLNVYPATRLNLSMCIVPFLGSCQQLDADKEIRWIIYIMDALALCFLWNRCISGCRYAFSTSSASAKSIVHGCFEAKSSSIQDGLSTSQVWTQHCRWPCNLSWQMQCVSGLMSVEHICFSMLPVTLKQPRYGMTFGKLNYGANCKAILLESGVTSSPIS